jgi:hypothetical protein
MESGLSPNAIQPGGHPAKVEVEPRDCMLIPYSCPFLSFSLQTQFFFLFGHKIVYLGVVSMPMMWNWFEVKEGKSLVEGGVHQENVDKAHFLKKEWSVVAFVR